MVESLKVFRDQVNSLAPKRSKASDGWIGDVKHQARHSDHNPEPDGTVDAFDLTNDPTNGVDTAKVAEALLSSRDKRISYIICNGRIASGRNGPKPWVWRKYTGSNGHYHHMHLSVLDEGQDDKTPWKIDSAFKKTPAKPQDLGMTPKQVSSVLKVGSKGEFVKELQENLKKLGYLIDPDGQFGTETEAAVKQFQREQNLVADGWAGPRTVEAISKQLEKARLQPKVDQAEAKVEVAKTVVDEAANNGKVTTTEILTGVTGLTAISATVKQIVDVIRESTESVSSLVSLGPWVLLGVVAAGAAGYVIYTRRRQRLDAEAVKQVL